MAEAVLIQTAPELAAFLQAQAADARMQMMMQEVDAEQLADARAASTQAMGSSTEPKKALTSTLMVAHFTREAVVGMVDMVAQVHAQAVQAQAAKVRATHHTPEQDEMTAYEPTHPFGDALANTCANVSLAKPTLGLKAVRRREEKHAILQNNVLPRVKVSFQTPQRDHREAFGKKGGVEKNGGGCLAIKR